MKIKHLFVAVLSAGCLLGSLASCGDGNNGGDNTQQSQKYKINWQNGSSYEFERLAKEAEAGETISFRIKLTGSEVVGEVSYTTASGKKEVINPSSGSNPIYRFTMPAEDVTVNVTLASIQSIEVDATGAKKAFLLNSEFDSKGLVVKAVMTGASEAKEVTTFSVEAPDMTTAGSKTVTVTYGGQTSSYTIKVGDLTKGAVDIIKTEDNKVKIIVSGDYSGFDSADELKEAAKGSMMFDMQNNANLGAPDWSRNLKTSEINYLDNGAGHYKFEVDVTDFNAAGGNGIGYTMHYGFPNAEGQDAGEASDWKPTTAFDKSVEIGTKKYRLVVYPGSAQGTEFWGCPGLLVSDTTTPSVTANGFDIRVEENKVYAVIAGVYDHLTDKTGEAIASKLLVDMQAFGSWEGVTDFNADKNIKFIDDNNGAGKFEVYLDMTGKLTAGKDYFFHFHFDPNGNPVANEHNVSWFAGLEEKSVNGPDGIYSFKKNVTSDWSNGLLFVNFLGGDYSMKTGVDIAVVDNKAVFTLSGVYSGADYAKNDAEQYYLDCEDLQTNTEISNHGADTVVTFTPASEGATQGIWTITLDVTGKLTDGYDYFFHFGPAPEDGGYRANLYDPAKTEEKTIEVGNGAYTLHIASGYTNSSETWRNNLVLVTFHEAK